MLTRISRQAYNTDVSQREWDIICPYIPEAAGGRPAIHTRREIVNAIFYIIRSGCAWRLLPHDVPPWKTVYHYWRVWRLDGTWERIHTALREQARVRAGRVRQPSAGVIDRQTITTTGVGGPRGYDGGKKMSGRKRHVLVDTQGLLLRVKVHPADVQDRAGVPLLLDGAARQFPKREHVWLDHGSSGSGKAWIEQQLGWRTTIVKHPPKPRGVWTPLGDLTDRSRLRFAWIRRKPQRTGFRGIGPRRWVVERTFAWLGQNRRLSKDYERLCATSETLIYATMSRLMVRRLARA